MRCIIYKKLRYTIDMNIVLFIPHYIVWHYRRGIIDIYHNLIRGVIFVGTWFSVLPLLKTFFSPWRRLGDEYRKGFHPEDFFSSLLVNTILRLLGMSIRFVVIACGIIATFSAAVLAVVIFISWILFPLLFAFFIALAIKNLA